MKWRNGLVLIGVIVIAALLAFPLRDVVTQLIVLPLSYVFWLLYLVYLSLDQSIWWAAVLAIVLFVLAGSLLPEIKPSSGQVEHKVKLRGSVETFATALRGSHRGVYFKWLVANRLGRLAYQMITLREHGRPRSVFDPLVTEGWTSPDEVQLYLEKGLRGSFTDLPRKSWWKFYLQPVKTPLDLDIDEVVGFLESKIEMNHSSLSHRDAGK